jgi:hypothetical protein
MVIGIFGNTIIEGKQFLDNIIGKMMYKDVESVCISKNYSGAVLTDGTIYRVLLPKDSSRGLKIDKAYVSKSVSVEFVKEILPFLFNGDTDIEYFN